MDILTPADVIEIAKAIEAVALQHGYGEVKIVIQDGRIRNVVTQTSTQREKV